MIEDKSDPIKKTELNLLVAFIDCCEKMGLRYYLMGGTMLGAVRHQGFIPWDDDIDVGMPRKDYEEFLSGAQTLLPDYYFVQCRKTDPELPNNIAKLRDSRTTFIEASVKDKKINHGIYIDIFPLDYYPDDPKKQKKTDRLLRLLSLRIRPTFTLPQGNKHSGIIEFGVGLAAKALSLKWPTIDDALNAREKLYKSVSYSGYLANYGGAWGKKEVVPADWYGEGAEGSFEGLPVRLPKEYDKWLTRVYGDYMLLPPEEKRVTHHYTIVIDTERPYTDYI